MSNQSVMICKMERSENRKVQTLEEKVAVSHSLKKKTKHCANPGNSSAIVGDKTYGEQARLS